MIIIENCISVGEKIHDITDKMRPIIPYETISYVSNITMKRRTCKFHGRTFYWLSPMFKNLKDGYLFIVVDRDDVSRSNPNLCNSTSISEI